MSWITLFLLSFPALLSPHLTLSINTSYTTKGFSLQLFDLDSLDVENLTTTQRLHRLVDSSDARIRWLNMSASQPQVIGISPPITYHSYKYTVKLGVGPKPKYQNLLLDTGSDLTWIQCYPPTVGFPQDPPRYKDGRSSSFHRISCDHQLCVPRICFNNICHFSIRYMDTKYTKGLLGTEQFTSRRRSGGTVRIGPLVFGCSKESSTDMFRGTRRIAGMLGLGRGPRSFVSQLGDDIEHRFSYCLPSWNSLDHSIGHLRIGSDAILTGNEQSTAFEPPYSSLYYLSLEDISVNNQPLHFPPGTFARQADGTGGFIIDSGCGISRMLKLVYDAVESSLKDHFRAHNLHITKDHRSISDLCYHTPHTFTAYPSMTFHFADGAELKLRKDRLFHIFPVDSTFCLTLKSHDRLTVLGAAQMGNMRFVFDVQNQRLSFAPEICG